MKVYIVIKQTERGDMFTSEIVKVFSEYKKAIAFVNDIQDKETVTFKPSYDIDEYTVDEV